MIYFCQPQTGQPASAPKAGRCARENRGKRKERDNEGEVLGTLLVCTLIIQIKSRDSPHISGAPGSLSITYFPLATLMSGTPGIFRNRCLRALSFVPTMYILFFVTLSTKQSSA